MPLALPALISSLESYPELKPYAAQIVGAADALVSHSTRPVPVTVERLAWLIAAIGHVETEWGTVKGKNGTTGPTILGLDGHGSGLMQIDDRAHPVFCAKKNLFDGAPLWTVPSENILYGAGVLVSGLISFAGSERPAVASYNCGAGNVRKALAAGLDPAAYTNPKGAYNARVSAALVSWGQPALGSK